MYLTLSEKKSEKSYFKMDCVILSLLATHGQNTFCHPINIIKKWQHIPPYTFLYPNINPPFMLHKKIVYKNEYYKKKCLIFNTYIDTVNTKFNLLIYLVF